MWPATPDLRCRRPTCGAAGFGLVICLIAVAAQAQGAASLEQARQLHREGQLDAALESYQAVIAGDAAAADRATAANNACVILLNDERLAPARELCELARRLRLDIGDDQRLARTLNNLGAVQEASGDYVAAADTYSQALAINRRLDDVASITVNEANLGVLALQQGQYGEALRRFDAVERHAGAHPDEPWAQQQQVFARINRGVAFERVGAFREALEAYQSVADYGLDARRAADLDINIGVAFRNLGDPLRALSKFDQAGQRYQAAGVESDMPALWLNRGLVYHFNLGRPQEANEAYTTALRLARASGVAEEQLQALYYLGRLALDTGNFDVAHTALVQALQLAGQNASLEGQWSAHEGLARLALARNDLESAGRHLDSAIGLVESARAGIAVRDVRQRYFGSRRSIYDLQVETAWRRLQSTADQSFIDQAFAAAQAAKARELASTIAGSPDALDLRSISQRLRRPLVEFYFAENDLFAWYADDGRLALQRLAPAAEVRNAARQAYARLQGGGSAEAEMATLARLLAPALAWLGTAPEVYVAPDGPLFHIPFELLPDGSGSVLLEHRQIAYYPSAAVAASVPHRERGRRQLTFAAVGPPPGMTTVTINGIETTLPPLPDARRETESLHRKLPGKHRVLADGEARLAAVSDMLGAGADIAHFSTHAVLDNRFGPAIVLSGDTGSDGLLTAASIQAAGPFDIGLAVLAACRSGVGGIEDGFAINSLGGAWLAAGVEAIVVTLWDVSDRYTNVFMQRFYGRLARGAQPAAALAATKREFRRRAPDNPAWAAYVLIGDTDPLFSRSPRYGLLVAGLVLLAAAWLLRRRLRG